MKLIELLFVFVALLLVMIHPFLPGDYNAFGLQLALFVEFFSLLGLLTYIPAFLWLFHSWKYRKSTTNNIGLAKQKKIWQNLPLDIRNHITARLNLKSESTT